MPCPPPMHAVARPRLSASTQFEQHREQQARAAGTERMIDPLGLHAGALERTARRDRSELDGRDVPERADVVGHRRARAADDEDVRFVHRSHPCAGTTKKRSQREDHEA